MIAQAATKRNEYVTKSDPILVFDSDNRLIGSVYAERQGWRRAWFYRVVDGPGVPAGWTMGDAQSALYAAVTDPMPEATRDDRTACGEATSLTRLTDGTYRATLDGQLIGHVRQVDWTFGWDWRQRGDTDWHTGNESCDSAWDALLVATGVGR